MSLLASIPAPPGNSFSLGPLTFNYYGLMIALGVLAAVEIGRRRWQAQGGDPDDITSIATVGVPAGLIGARLYHVITDWKMYTDSPLDVFAIWNGGLGIPGGLLLGVAAGVWQARRKGITGDRLWDVIDAVIPGIPVAQAIGRVGNWFNQEVFGGPSDLPWALEVDPRYRPEGYAEFNTFHPAFLYEALLNLTLAGTLIMLDRTERLGRGQILPLWIAGYGVLRFLIESIRTDEASLILGVRVNHWTSAIAVIVGLMWFRHMRRQAQVQAATINSFEDLAADEALLEGDD
ncbi:MAG: prolipoprotein diacylglyceryl transferase, partial [Acidimicrobiales bacterium]|nr:prolipoprotein diacylglyceryl transferase [Acidimicrobiales bacterium]